MGDECGGAPGRRRARLIKEFATADVPEGSAILLQGGDDSAKYDTDEEVLFRCAASAVCCVLLPRVLLARPRGHAAAVWRGHVAAVWRGHVALCGAAMRPRGGRVARLSLPAPCYALRSTS